MPRFIFESIALPSSTADCTPSKNKLRSDSTSVPPSIHHPSIPDETADSSNSLTPSIISLTDRLHVTFADNHTDLISSNGTPVASRSNSHLHHQNLELDNIPEDESSAHVAKTIFHDGDSDDETTNQNTSIHNSEMKIESNLNISSPSGRIKQYGSTSTHPNRGVVQPQIHDESLKSNLSPCKRSRSS